MKHVDELKKQEAPSFSMLMPSRMNLTCHHNLDSDCETCTSVEEGTFTEDRLRQSGFSRSLPIHRKPKQALHIGSNITPCCA